MLVELVCLEMASSRGGGTLQSFNDVMQEDRGSPFRRDPGELILFGAGDDDKVLYLFDPFFITLTLQRQREGRLELPRRPVPADSSDIKDQDLLHLPRKFR